MRVILQRVTQSTETLGVLIVNGKPEALTLEDPWNNNQPRISCIPSGKYPCTPHNGTHFQNVWLVNNVPGREAILIHQGNTVDDTIGCILVGNQYGIVNGKYGILNSVTTLNKLRNLLPPKFTLEIIDVMFDPF